MFEKRAFKNALGNKNIITIGNYKGRRMILHRYYRKKTSWTSDSLDAQITILSQYDWGREIDWGLTEKQNDFLCWGESKEMTGWIPIVFDRSLVTCDETSDFQYGNALNRLFENLKKASDGTFIHYRDGQSSNNHYRRSMHSINVLDMLWRAQGCPVDILLIPMEFEILEEGKIRRDSFQGWTQTGLGTYEIGTLFLTHKDYYRTNSRWYLCLGDHYSPDGDMDDSPIYGFDNTDHLVFPAYRIHNNTGYLVPFTRIPMS